MPEQTIQDKVDALEKEQLEMKQEQLTMKQKQQAMEQEQLQHKSLLDGTGKRIGLIEIQQQRDVNSKKNRSVILFKFEG